MMTKRTRRFAHGAELDGDGVSFRVLAPERSRVEVVVQEGALPPRRAVLEPDAEGFFSAHVADVRAGARYAYRLDDDDDLLPDPASRFQPEGPHAPSEVIDPRAFSWTDEAWPGISLLGQVLYEIHVGTFTQEGTFASAASELERLCALGIRSIELLPVAEFDGRFGWGYDGVDLYAPFHHYGRPDDLRALVDRAHALGIGVVLDVVYNHFGPSGAYHTRFCERFVTKKYENEWGAAIDFESLAGVRSFFVENARYWIEEFHVDGLRLDATQALFDASPVHVITEIADVARRAAAPKPILLVGENEPQRAELVRPASEGGSGLDALWNDDFHHTVRVALVGRREAYLSNTRGTPQELVSAAKWGYLFQGQHYPWQGKPRGQPALDLDAARFVLFLENHDQVANGGRGARLGDHAGLARVRAMTALLLLAPGTPMLFQGQELGRSSPFHYFADHDPELARLVEKGRREFLAQFESMTGPAARDAVPTPHEARTFTSCQLPPEEELDDAQRAHRELHRELLRLRREDPTFAAQRADVLHGAVTGPQAFVLRLGTGSGADRLLLVNLGIDVALDEVAEPLLAPPRGTRWSIVLSTEEPRFGGSGAPPIPANGVPPMPGCAASVLAPVPKGEDR